MRNIRNLILQHTKITNNHLTPELSLRLITPDCELWSAKSEEVPFEDDPFWGFYWPGGQAVARYLLDGGVSLTHRNVIDVGCGCGAGAIAARKMGANRVLANDIDFSAIEATRINIDLNFVNNIETDNKNYIDTKCEEFDTILIGDMFYDEEFANYLFNWLKNLASKGKMVLIGDPGRHALTGKKKESLSLLAKYKLPENSCLENSGFQEATVWKIV